MTVDEVFGKPFEPFHRNFESSSVACDVCIEFLLEFDKFGSDFFDFFACFFVFVNAGTLEIVDNVFEEVLVFRIERRIVSRNCSHDFVKVCIQVDFSEKCHKLAFSRHSSVSHSFVGVVHLVDADFAPCIFNFYFKTVEKLKFFD